MAATIQSIDAAIFAALESLLVANGGPYESVIRFASQSTGRDQQRELNTVALGETPAAILAWEGEKFAAAPGMVTAALGPTGFLGTSVYRVYVSHSELSGHDTAITGTNVSPGIQELVDRVVTQLAGLRIDGLYRTSRLVPLDTTPELVKPGAYVYRLRFSAQRFVDAAEIPDDSVAMEDTVARVFPKFQDDTGDMVDGITDVDFTVDLTE